MSTQSGFQAPEQTDKVEVLLAILLGIAAVATAFAAFKASLIGDEVISNYNQGIRKVDEASQLYNEGNQYLAQDQAVFLEYVKAAQVGDTELADYIRETLMSEELYNGLGWWETSADATTPFVPENPDYYLPQFDQAIALDEEVDEHFTLAADADEESDRFEFATVLLAAVLFFLGMASVVRSSKQRRTFLVMGAVVLLASLVQLAMLLL